LKNSKPLTFVFILIGTSTILGLIFAFPVGALFGILGYVVAFIAGGIIRLRYVIKTVRKFDGSVSADELIPFLNEHLSYLSPYLHEWGYLKQSGFWVKTIDPSVPDESKAVWLCAEFGPRRKRLATICIEPQDVNNPDSGTTYSFGAGDNGVTFRSFNAGFLRHVCLFKTTPILQAAVEYYNKSVGLKKP